MGSALFIILLLIFGGLLYFLYRLYEQDGINLFLVLATIVAFIMSLKVGKITSFDANIYVSVYMSIFMAFYLMIEKGYEKNFKRALYLISFVCLVMIAMFCLSYFYIPTISNTLAINIKRLFISNFINLLAFPILLIGSVWGSVFLYKYTKKYYNHIFVNSCFAAIIIQFIDSLIISVLSLYNVLKFGDILGIALMTYSFKLMANVLYIPIFYLISKYKKVKHE